MPRLSTYFTRIGGEFLTDEEEIARRLSIIRAFLFDWDGVFNFGEKGEGKPSTFTEADSMGLNLLRFGYWINREGQIPYVGIISGQENASARSLAEREHFHSVYSGYRNKLEALDAFCKKYDLKHEEVAWTFDDVIDLAVARRCGLRFLIRRESSPLFMSFVADAGMADYVTGREGGYHSVREICELVLGMYGTFFDTVKERMEFTDRYQRYLTERNAIVLHTESAVM